MKPNRHKRSPGTNFTVHEGFSGQVLPLAHDLFPLRIFYDLFKTKAVQISEKGPITLQADP